MPAASKNANSTRCTGRITILHARCLHFMVACVEISECYCFSFHLKWRIWLRHHRRNSFTWPMSAENTHHLQLEGKVRLWKWHWWERRIPLFWEFFLFKCLADSRPSTFTQRLWCGFSFLLDFLKAFAGSTHFAIVCFFSATRHEQTWKKKQLTTIIALQKNYIWRGR